MENESWQAHEGFLEYSDLWLALVRTAPIAVLPPAIISNAILACNGKSRTNTGRKPPSVHADGNSQTLRQGLSKFRDCQNAANRRVVDQQLTSQEHTRFEAIMDAMDQPAIN